jgi:hypothetical protein
VGVGAEPVDAGARAVPVVEDKDDEGLLGGSLLDRAEVPITRPKDYREKTKAPELPAEGSMLFDRLCRLERDASGWMLLTFVNDEDETPEDPRWVLPCRLLEKMEGVAAKTPGVTFRISGESTVYDSRSFLLLRKVTARTPSEPPKPPTPPKPRKAPPLPAPRAKPAEKPPAKATTQPDKSGEAPPSSEDILNQLLKDKPGKPIIPEIESVQDVPVKAPSVAPAPKEKTLPVGRGNMVVDRIVTLLPVGVGKWMQVSFVSDNTLREPPMRLLPCTKLTQAEALAASGAGKSVRLRVTGEITVYKGRRYLLLRKLLVERDMGQF